jgi:hypothetical protein
MFYAEEDEAIVVDTLGRQRIINPKFHKFQLLEEVFTQFLQTNEYRQQHFTIDALLKLDNTHKKFLKYEHGSVPYLATVFVFDGPHKPWLNIKLHSDGFAYLPKRREIVPPRHRCDGWVLLTEKDWQYMPQLLKTFTSFANGQVYQLSRMFYNDTARRLDIKFDSKDDNYNSVVITFEEGYPYYEE